MEIERKQILCGLGCLSLLAGIGLASSPKGNFLFNKEETVDVDTGGGTTASIETTNMHINGLNKVDNQDGTETISFTYTIIPENATNPSISTLLSWVDTSYSENIDVYFSVSVDENNKTVAIICKKAFDHQAKLTLSSVDVSSISASLTLDYQQKFLGLNQAITSPFPTLYLTKSTSGTNIIGSNLVKCDENYLTYSIGTKDHAAYNKNFNLKNISLNDPVSFLISGNSSASDIADTNSSKIDPKDFRDKGFFTSLDCESSFSNINTAIVNAINSHPLSNNGEFLEGREGGKITYIFAEFKVTAPFYVTSSGGATIDGTSKDLSFNVYFAVNATDFTFVRKVTGLSAGESNVVF
jgi:hypothetical protein